MALEIGCGHMGCWYWHGIGAMALEIGCGRNIG